MRLGPLGEGYRPLVIRLIYGMHRVEPTFWHGKVIQLWIHTSIIEEGQGLGQMTTISLGVRGDYLIMTYQSHLP